MRQRPKARKGGNRDEKIYKRKLDCHDSLCYVDVYKRQAPEQITQAMINQRELDIIGSRMSAFQFEPTIQRMEKGELDTEGIATALIPFGEVQQVFKYMDHPAPESKKMVILF